MINLAVEFHSNNDTSKQITNHNFLNKMILFKKFLTY